MKAFYITSVKNSADHPYDPHSRNPIKKYERSHPVKDLAYEYMLAANLLCHQLNSFIGYDLFDSILKLLSFYCYVESAFGAPQKDYDASQTEPASALSHIL